MVLELQDDHYLQRMVTVLSNALCLDMAATAKKVIKILYLVLFKRLTEIRNDFENLPFRLCSQKEVWFQLKRNLLYRSRWEGLNERVL